MKAASLGVNFVPGVAVGFESSGGVPDRLLFTSLSNDTRRQVRSLRFRRCVDCGGPWSRDVARLAGVGTGTGSLSVDVPVEPRCVVILVCMLHMQDHYFLEDLVHCVIYSSRFIWYSSFNH